MSVAFCLHITAGLHAQGVWSALRFAEAAQRKGHRIRRVFFSGQAVAIAQRFASVADGEADPRAAWLRFAEDQQLELHVCSAAAQRLGLLSDAEARALHHESEVFTHGALHPAFVVSGLGTLVESLLEQQRILHFPE